MRRICSGDELHKYHRHRPLTMSPALRRAVGPREARTAAPLLQRVGAHCYKFPSLHLPPSPVLHAEFASSTFLESNLHPLPSLDRRILPASGAQSSPSDKAPPTRLATMDFSHPAYFSNPQPYQFIGIPPLTPSHSNSAASDDFNTTSPPVSDEPQGSLSGPFRTREQLRLF
jgi:hypothetical protein